MGDGASARPAAASVVSLVIPTHWETWQAAELIYEAAMGYVAAEALPRLRNSFIQYADALTNSLKVPVPNTPRHPERAKTRSIPNIPFIEINPMPLKQLSQFFLERFTPMMFGLILNVFNNVRRP